MAESEQLPVPQARAGEQAAWDTLFRRYQLPLYTYVFELVHDEQVSLDIVQDTFINAARHIGGLRDDDKFGGWLFGIAHQKCVQRWRKQSREQALRDEFSADPPELEEGPDEFLVRREEENQVMELLNQLSQPHRSVVLLHYLEDFSLEEIAEITGANLGTVKSRLHYAKRSLKKLMESRQK